MEHKQLNSGQGIAYNAAMSGADVFITGGAGTGKSYLLKIIINDLKAGGKQVIVCAPTGVAASNIGGTTIHRVFDFRSTAAFSDKKLEIIKRAPKTIKQADVLIIDEISMCRMDIFDAIYASLEKVRATTGKRPQLIVVGDFYQLPPVLRDDTGEKELLERYYKRPIKDAYAFLSDSWSKFNFKCIELTEIVRQAEKTFSTALNLAREGNAISIPFFNRESSTAEITEAPKLYAYNEDVDKANLDELAKLPCSETIFDTITEGLNIGMDEMDIPNRLHLKPGCRVVITSNDARGKYADNLDLINPNTNWLQKKELLNKDMYHNGSLGTVSQIYKDPADYSQDYVIIRLDNGPTIMLYRQDYDVIRYKIDADTETISTEVLGTYHQFPLRLAYALTIHKGQGQTYDRVNVEPLCKNPGQLYVALSRVRNIKNMYLFHEITPFNLFANPLVKEFYSHLGESDYKYSWMSVPEKISVTERPETPILESIQSKVKKSTPKKKTPGEPVKNGRPARYPNGSKVVRIPTELNDGIAKVLDRICPKGGMNIDELNRFSAIIEEYLSK